MLLIDVLRSNVAARKFQLHDFVIMPDHLHLLMTLPGNMTIEKAMQLIKGGFSYRLKKEFGYQGEVWQRGFSEVRISDGQSFFEHREYIAQNPVKAGLVDTAEEYPYGYTHLAKKKAQGLKPSSGVFIRARLQSGPDTTRQGSDYQKTRSSCRFRCVDPGFIPDTGVSAY
jgi:putative transposase